MTVLVWTGVAFLGGIGALARFRLDGLVQRRYAGELPLGTLVVNVAGAFALGVVSGLSVRGDALLLAGAGALGSFTTFSTWMLEAERLGEEGERRLGLVNVFVALAGGLAAAWLGRVAGATL